MRDLNEGHQHPRDVKMRLAREIVSIFHTPRDAEHAEKAFIRVFQESRPPERIPEVHLRNGQSLIDLLDLSGLVPTRSEGRRLLKQNAVRLNGNVLTDPNMLVGERGVLKIGKRRYLRIT